MYFTNIVSFIFSVLYFFVIGLVGLCCMPQPLVIIIIIKQNYNDSGTKIVRFEINEKYCVNLHRKCSVMLRCIKFREIGGRSAKSPSTSCLLNQLRLPIAEAPLPLLHDVAVISSN